MLLVLELDLKHNAKVSSVPLLCHDYNCTSFLLSLMIVAEILWFIEVKLTIDTWSMCFLDHCIYKSLSNALFMAFSGAQCMYASSCSSFNYYLEFLYFCSPTRKRFA